MFRTFAVNHASHGMKNLQAKTIARSNEPQDKMSNKQLVATLKLQIGRYNDTPRQAATFYSRAHR
jgi:hypothetical protein